MPVRLLMDTCTCRLLQQHIRPSTSHMKKMPPPTINRVIIHISLFIEAQGWRLLPLQSPQLKQMGRARAASCSSSSTESSTQTRRNLSTDLRLGLSISASQQDDPFSLPSVGDDDQASDWPPTKPLIMRRALEEEENEGSSATFFVKVYMEGIPIGRKLDLLAHDGYHDLIRTLDYMFSTNIIWSEMDGSVSAYSETCHVLTYEDKEGDWMMVGDVPWEMFLSTVRRLKITRAM